MNEYLKSWKVPANGSWQPQITLRQLLTHSAGLTVHGFPGYLRTAKLPTVVEILNGESPANTDPVRANLLPGSHTRYSGGGTTVGQLLICDVLQKPFPQSMREIVFEPLEMDQSTYEQPLPRSLHKEAATAHPSNYRRVDGKWHVYPEMAAAGLWTTPSDLARAGLELQLALKGESNRLLSPSQANRMIRAGRNESVALGFFLSGEGKNSRFAHGGWDEGFVAQMTMYRDRGLGAVVMVNSNEGNALLQEIERAIAREYDWPDYFKTEKRSIALDPKVVEAYVGEYVGKGDFQCSLIREGKKLFFQAKGQNPIELQAESETNFFTTVLNLQLNAIRDPDGQVKSLICDQEGRKTELDPKKR